MRAYQVLVSMALVLLFTGCTGEPEETGDDTPPKNQLTFSTGEFEIPEGDSFTCFYTDTFTDRELSVVNAFGHQGAGGHHIVAYWTDNPRNDAPHPCKDSEMIEWHQIAGGGDKEQGAEGLVGLPDGLAARIPSGKQIVIQAHYINTTGKPMKVTDDITLNLIDPSKVKAYANYFVTLDAAFEAPPHGTYEHVSYCTVNRDFKTVLSLGHMHEWGKHFRLESVDENDKTIEVLRDDEWRPEYTSHPPLTKQTMEEPYMLKKGTRLKQTCSWDNTTPDPLIFPREMCLAFFYYYPDEGQITCNTESP